MNPSNLDFSKVPWPPLPRMGPPQHKNIFNDSIFFKTMMSGVMGGALGGVFGGVVGIYGKSSLSVAATSASASLPKLPIKTQIKEALQNGKIKAKSHGKTFAKIGAYYTLAESITERIRAKHDLWNSLYAGCATGAALAVGSGPGGMCAGCAGFAAFSVVIDKFMGDRSD
eukprot:GCRY01004244.1.p1 GENE.GCRY01004244.1~~GCRY01004244.1.p1  ORF type:complete len:170 (+),score=13.50 GCRY01004244.1:120-629(+)